MMRQVILHNVRSQHNVGSVFRTSDGAGVAKIWLTGYTPTPVDRFGRTVTEIQKTSLGATTSVAWEGERDIKKVVTSLKEAGYTVVAVEQRSDSCSLYEYQPDTNVAYIFGNEVEGVPTEILDMADVILEIPMAGMKESLNVSVTAGIVLFKHPYVSA